MSIDLMPGFGAFTQSSGVVVYTWDPAFTSTLFTLSGGNLTITSTGANVSANGQSVRGTVARSTGKFHFEMNTGTASARPGIMNASANIENMYLGEDNNSLGMYGSGGVDLNNSTIGTGASISASNTDVAVEVDLDAELIWFAVNGGNWNNNGSADPATGTGGFDFSSANAGPWYPALYSSPAAGSQTATGRFTATGATKAISSGFLAWDGTS